MRSPIGWASPALALVILGSCRATLPPPPVYDWTTGESVVKAMFDRYTNRWFNTLTYVQNNVAIDESGDSTRSVWLNAIRMQDRATDPLQPRVPLPRYQHRIDFDPLELHEGTFFSRDTQYLVLRGVVTRVMPSVNPLFLLTHEVYSELPSLTMRRLRAAGINLDYIREDIWRDRPVWVVGTLSRNLDVPQFWVDREYLLLVRLIDRSGPDGGLVETQLSRYERVGSSWIPRVVEIRDGRRLLERQEFHQITGDQPLDSLLFDPYRWTSGRHWYQQPPGVPQRRG